MATELIVYNKILTQRYVTDYLYDPNFPIVNVAIGVSKPVINNQEPGFIVRETTIQELFKRTIYARYNERTIVQKGVTLPPEATLPPAPVPFSPSLEATARYFYTLLLPEIKKLNITLDYVAVISPLATARFGRNMNA
ncbi:hypothetical protein A374_06406 [Fictibacillus macauensis ZFHKF-1]|uniref:Uncharacterized protein n=1 Tax=Fictibacillus macauensis ZFHKF-1 TaxID=1196324 RepID=I8AKU4_9BACL|nr:hypothetical protein [Fictibacillus macauensis]EIT86209.1 hypothetical protein A374_06406 [Fictibacillus macauensis ZFHKF-1]